MGITGISSMATRGLLADVAQDWQTQNGEPVRIDSMGGIVAAQHVRQGAVIDVVVLAADAIEALATSGHVVAASVVALARSGVAIAVPRGAPHPLIDSESALIATLRDAPRIGYSTGPSGKALLQLFARWRIEHEIADRLVQAPPGVPVGALLARGEVTLGFQQRSELINLDGIDIIGPMPTGLEIVTTFSVAISAQAPRPDRARAFIDFIRSPGRVDAIRRYGMDPI